MVDNLAYNLKVDPDRPDGKADLEAEYVVFQLAGQEYGINIVDINEVIRVAAMAEPPEPIASVVGLINIRGSVVPVVDLRLRLHLPGAEYTLATPILITTVNNNPVGLIVDRVTEVKTLPAAAIERPPEAIAKSTCVAGVAKAGAKLIFLLNLVGVFTADEAQILEEMAAASKLHPKTLARKG